MPLFKTFSGADKQIVKPEEWTLIRFDNKDVFKLPATGWTAMEVMLRVEYPKLGCPKSLRGRFVRWPNTPQADETGHDDKATFPGLVRHHHWQHFILNRKDLEIGFIVWHDGKKPIILDGRQFKWVRLK